MIKCQFSLVSLSVKAQQGEDFDCENSLTALPCSLSAGLNKNFPIKINNDISFQFGNSSFLPLENCGLENIK